MMKNKLLATLALAGILLTNCSSPAPDTAQWRGPERNGIFPGSGTTDAWPEEGPELLWIFEGLGKGYASPAVTYNRIYIKGEDKGKEYLFALNLKGEELWRSENGYAFLGDGFSATYPGARSTPMVVENLVYTSSGMGEVACFDVLTGKKHWSKNILDDLGGELGYFGYSESPLVDETQVYVFPSGQQRNMCALDRISGEISWSTPALRDTFAYGSPILAQTEQREVVLSTSRHHIMALEKNTGELLSHYPLEGYEYDGEHCNSLIYQDEHIWFVANDIPGQGALKLKLSKDGRTITEVWRNPRVMNNFGGFLVLEGSLYTTIKGNKLVKLDPENGAITDTLKVSSGSLIATGGKIITYGNNGRIHLVDTGEERLKDLGSWKIQEGSGQHFAHPVVRDGVLYIRRGDALMAYDIS